MFAKKLSLALLGLVALPSIAAARPAVRSDDSRTVASDRAAARTDERGERTAHGAGRLEGLCARLSCTAEQVTAMRSIVHGLHERLVAERKDDRKLFERVKEMRKDGLSDEELSFLKGAIAGERREYERLFHEAALSISKVLDDEQRALFMGWVEKVGAKAALGMGRHHGGAKAGTMGHRGGKAKMMRERAAKADMKRDRAAKVDMKRDRAAKSERAAKMDRPAKTERKLAKAERKRERHSAKA